MSTIAVFLALGGTSYAVARNSIGTRELKNDAVISSKVRNGTITKADLAGNALQSATRGPRGPQGPPGEIGPSRVVEVDRDAGMAIPSQGGGTATLVTTTLEPGAWVLEAQTTVIYSPSSPGSEWYICALHTAAGVGLGRGTVRVGTDALATLAAPIAARAAATFPTETQVIFSCTHPSSVGTPAAQADATALTATRVGSIENRS